MDSARSFRGHLLEQTQVMVEPNTQMRNSRFRLLAISLGLVTLLAILGVGWYRYRITQVEERLQKALAEADRLDPGWTTAELEARREVISDESNSGLRVGLAKNYMPLPKAVGDINKYLDQLSPEQLLVDDKVKSLSTELEKVALLMKRAD